MENESETSCSSLLIRLFIKLEPAWTASADSSKVGITCRVSDRSRVEVHYSRTMWMPASNQAAVNSILNCCASADPRWNLSIYTSFACKQASPQPNDACSTIQCAAWLYSTYVSYIAVPASVTTIHTNSRTDPLPD